MKQQSKEILDQLRQELIEIYREGTKSKNASIAELSSKELEYLERVSNESEPTREVEPN